MVLGGHPDAAPAEELADLFCRVSRRTVERRFRDLWSNDDGRKYRLGVRVVEGAHRWMED